MLRYLALSEAGIAKLPRPQSRCYHSEKGVWGYKPIAQREFQGTVVNKCVAKTSTKTSSVEITIASIRVFRDQTFIWMGSGNLPKQREKPTKWHCVRVCAFVSDFPAGYLSAEFKQLTHNNPRRNCNKTTAWTRDQVQIAVGEFENQFKEDISFVYPVIGGYIREYVWIPRIIFTNFRFNLISQNIF